MVDPNKLAQYDLTALDVFAAVSKNNINVGGDIIEKNDQAYVVRGIGLLKNVGEVENIILDNESGTPILVKHVAEVHESKLPLLGYVGRVIQHQVIALHHVPKLI